jgi:hypothetical protein
MNLFRHPRPLLLAVLLGALTTPANAGDNRFKNYNAGDTIPDPFVGLSEEGVLAKIALAKDAKLNAALTGQKLLWQNQIDLVDVDVILCLFAFNWRSDPGPNHRTLVLFTTDYRLKAWGSFECHPSFEFGTTYSPRKQTDTYFVTVNQGWPAESLWFEKYRIISEKIERLGEGYELTKIPNLN